MRSCGGLRLAAGCGRRGEMEAVNLRITDQEEKEKEREGGGGGGGVGGRLSMLFCV